MTCAPRMNASLLKAIALLSSAKYFPSGPGQHRAQVEFTEGLRAADAAGDSDRDREARDVCPSQASRR
jgi:hypothetical protein